MTQFFADPRPTIFADSPAMRAVVHQLAHIAGQPGGVLISGELATGRRMLARELHRLTSQDDSSPFVAVPCSGDSTAIEQLLLGGRTPTPSDASGAGGLEQVGDDSLICAAAAGTLFLADVAGLPARVQARLARILRDGEVMLAESRRVVSLCLRPVASCTGAIDEALADGGFRGDLYRLLSVHRVAVPPLRDRREDIPKIANRMLQETCVAQNLPPKAIERPALALLSAMPWRGNAIELEALILAVAARSPHDAVRLEDVLTAVRLDGAARRYAGTGTLREAKTQFERDYITEVLELHKGRVSEAARALGVQRTNLYRKLRLLGVTWSQD
jgi:DNA-binding NtrC family response regulator